LINSRYLRVDGKAAVLAGAGPKLLYLLMSLDRFHQAQAGRLAGYDTALAEIQRGRKVGHWIWFIFPQIASLGHSSAAREYAIRDLEEAVEYLRDPVLRARYEQIAGAVKEQLANGRALEELMGSEIDALKLVSSLTLFRVAARGLAAQDETFASLVQSCNSILRQTSAQGYPPCARTLAQVEQQ
jgi:uncharacterized protein (DUF1810 family)